MKAHVADWRYRVKCARIVPAGDQPVIRLANYPVPLVMSNGEVYQVESGYEFSGMAATADLSGGSADLEGILQMGAITREALQSGVYDNARVYIFATTWTNPIEDEEPCDLCFFGKVETTDFKFSVQLMSAKDVLSQNTGRTYSPTCPYTLFDQHLGGSLIAVTQSRCIGPRAAPDGPNLASYLVTGTLTSVTDQYMFADSARGEAADWFAYGSIRLTSGPNAGLKPIQLKAFTAGGVILLHEPMFYLPQVGDTYEMIPGCRKRHVEDCVTKWGNGINFGGQPHVPAPSVYAQVGRGA